MKTGNSMREMSILKILDDSFSLYLARMEPFFLTFLILNIINTALVYAVRYLVPPFNPPYNPADNLFLWLINYGVSAITVFSFLFLAIWALTNLGNGLIVNYAFNILEGKTASFIESFIFTINYSGRILAASIITGALMASGFILLVFPGLIAAIMFSLSIPIIVMERQGIFLSLRRSKDLTDKMWWKTFLLLFSIFFIIAMADLVVEVLGFSFPLRSWMIDILRIIITSFVEPIYPVSLTYYCRSLKEIKAAPMEYPLAEEPIPKLQEYMYPPRTTPYPYTSGVRFCPYCGQSIPQDANYCPNCGSKTKT